MATATRLDFAPCALAGPACTGGSWSVRRLASTSSAGVPRRAQASTSGRLVRPGACRIRIRLGTSRGLRNRRLEHARRIPIPAHNPDAIGSNSTNHPTSRRSHAVVTAWLRGSRPAAGKSSRRRPTLPPRATRRGWGSLFREPGLGLVLRDDGEDFDCRLRDVIEHPDLVNPEPVLWPIDTAQALDAGPAQLGRLVAQVQLDGVPDTRLEVGSNGSQALDRLRGQDDLERHLARL